MKFLLIVRLFVLIHCLFFLCSIKTAAQFAFKKNLFESDEVLSVTLKGNIHTLLNDRSDDAKSYPLILSYNSNDSDKIVIPVQLKTRGHFRKLEGNCTYPPLLIQFLKDGPQINTVFKEQHKLKLVMPCRGEEYLLREWLVYKLYNLVTPKSFNAQLVKITLDDTKSKKKSAPFYGIFLEEEKQMAKRNKMMAVERKLVPEQTQGLSFITMSVFEYLIGNTDWSVQYLQNIKLLAADSLAVPFTVPYDFDHAGIVNAPYALPAEELLMNSVRERRYRGYCIKDMKVFDPVIAYFNQLKDDIYRLYTGCALLDGKYIKTTIQYLDAFYKTINDTKVWQKDFGYPCDKNGTGNIVIKGLKSD